MTSRLLAQRRVGATVAFFVLVVFLLRGISPRESLRRATFLRAHSAQSLSARRLAGSASTADPRYLFFLEAVRKKLPPTTIGIAIDVPQASNWHVYLAEYHFAPIAVLVSPSRIPRGWSAAVYGDRDLPGWQVIARVPGGALLAPVQ